MRLRANRSYRACPCVTLSKFAIKYRKISLPQFETSRATNNQLSVSQTLMCTRRSPANLRKIHGHTRVNTQCVWDQVFVRCPPNTRNAKRSSRRRTKYGLDRCRNHLSHTHTHTAGHMTHTGGTQSKSKELYMSTSPFENVVDFDISPSPWQKPSC